jgi:Ca2+-binding RTX toxin-like protein
MTTSPLLMKAILAMDAYNRGYDAAIDLRPRDSKGQLILDSSGQPLASDKENTQIGNATIKFNSGIFSNSTERLDDNISFYAVAYDYNGEKVLSYRGTDSLGADTASGYGVGGGKSRKKPKRRWRLIFTMWWLVVVTQAMTNISLTGHSLGGGLAGLVGAVYGKSATLFDNMAFEGAAQNTKIFSDPASGSLYDATFKQKVYGNLAPWNPTISSASNSLLQTYYTNGEFLAANRSAQQTPQHGLDIGSGVSLPGVDSGLFGDNLHSIATLTILLYADASTGMGIPADWKNAAKYFWPVMYDDSFAAGIGNASSLEGTLHDAGKYSAIVRTAIAYSAIDEGARIYGDTGIRAFYDDANDLGKAIAKKSALSTTPNISETYLTDISKVFVQFAGQLALNQVLYSSATASVLDGVLTFSEASNNNTLTINFTDSLWKLANNGVSMTSIVGRDNLIKDLLLNAADSVYSDMRTQWGSIVSGSSHSEMNASIDRVVFATLNSSTSVIINNPTAKATLFVGGTGADNITGSNGRDLILGNGGGDQIHGGAGNDIFVAGRPAYSAGTSTATNYLYGDTGNDAVNYGMSGYGLIATMNGNNGHVEDTLNRRDVLSSIERLTLSNYGDTLKVNSGPSSGREMHFEGGKEYSGKDVADYTTANGIVIDNANTAQGAAPVIWNASGTGRDILTGFETINFSTGTIILPDLTSKTGNILNVDSSVRGPTHSYGYDYSAAKSAAYIDVGSFMGAGYTNTVTIGGITQLVGTRYEQSDITMSTPTSYLMGTNMGDTIRTGVSYGGQLTINTGFGNDHIQNVESAGDFGNYRTGLNIVYRGGNDIIDYGYTLNHVFLWEGIKYEDLTFGITKTAGGIVDQLVIGVQNYGTLTINNMNLTYINPWANSIVLQSGGIVTVTEGGIFYSPTANLNNGVPGLTPTVSGISGTWGVDKIIGHANDEIFYGLGDNDTIDGRDGNDTLYGGGGNDRLIGGNGNDILDGGFDNDTLIGGAGNNTLNGGDGFDIADYSAMTSGIIVNMALGSGTVKRGTETDTLTSIEKIIGTIYNDTANGGAGDDGFALSSGKDIFTDAGGVDTIKLAGGQSLETLSFSVSALDLKIIQTTGVNETALTGQMGVDASKYIENLQYADGFTIPLSQYKTWIKGTTAAETINGDAGGVSKDDIIVAGSGNDTINGLSGDDIISGDAGNDDLNGGLGNDRIEGGSGNDTISGNAGTDDLYGGLGDDIFIVKVGDGSDTLHEMLGQGSDTLKITGGILPANVQMWGDTAGTYIKYTANDVVFIPGTAYATIEKIVFDNGTVWSASTAFNMVDTDDAHSLAGGIFADKIDGKGGDDTIYGYEGNDTLTGGLGSDYIAGGKGDDTYILAVGDSLISTQDQIIEQVNEGTDTIKLVGVLSTSIQKSMDANGVVTIKYSATDQVSFGSDFDSTNGFAPLVEKLAFDNGTVIDIANGFTFNDIVGANSKQQGTIGADIINALDGNDTIYGFSGNDTITGGTGTDIIYGGKGDDTYVFKAGDSPILTPDYISENLNEGVDTIKLTGGILPANVQMWTDRFALHIRYSANDEIIVRSDVDTNTGAYLVSSYVEKIAFDNGTVWDLRNGLSLTDSNESHLLYGSTANDTLNGMGGDDNLFGASGNDILTGGTGNDMLYGGAGDDTFIFKVGDSSSAIESVAEYEGEGTDTIKLTGGILPANVTMWSDSNSNIINLRYSASDIISFSASNYNGSGLVSTIEKISFDNGTVWNLLAGITFTGDNTSQYMSGTSGNDVLNAYAGDDYIYGYNGNDTLNGGVGTDNLNGGTGDDTYIFKAGESLISSPDYITENLNEGVDTIKLTGGILPANVQMWTDMYSLHLRYSANDEIIIQSSYDPSTGASLISSYVEKIAFDNGTVWDLRLGLNMNDTNDSHYIYGSIGNDVIDGKGGDDYIYAYAGNDTLTGGVGQDNLYGGMGDDTYIFKVGDASLSSPDYVSENSNEGVDTIKLTGGVLPSNVILTVSYYSLTIQYSANDSIVISGDVDTATNSLTQNVEKIVFDNGTVWDFRNGITTSDSNLSNEVHGSMLKDIINGNGGNDTLYGEGNNDILNGGAGNDILYGGAGDDQYIYSAGGGQGNDIIHEESGDADTIVLGAGYTSANITLTRSGQYDLAINSAGQRLFLIEGQFYTGGSIETLKYGDGTTLNLMTYSHTVNGTASDDTLYGVSIGGGGNKLNGLDGNDYIYAGTNNDIVTGGNGNDTIFGEEGNDTLSGNAGDDLIYSGAGDDTIIYDSGSDIFVDNGGIDTIKITNAAFTSANMTLVRPSGNMYDLEVLFNGVHAFTIQGQFSPEQSFENIVFANGSSFNLANVQYTSLGTVDSDYIYGISYGGNPNDILKGNAGDDYIYALNGDDIITGGIGNDTLDGGYGSDIYNYNSGDGFDIIADISGNDVIQIGTSYTKSDLSWQRDVGTNNMILFLKGAQVMTLQDQFVVDHQIETVKFADGSSQTLVGLQISTNGTAGDDNLSGIDSNASQNDNINGFAGNDYIYGYEGNDTLTGGVGNDNIDGGNGNDIFVYNKGDGVDVITDSSGSDTIQVGAGYTKTELTWSRITGTYDLSLNLKGVKVITIQNHFMDGYAVENVKFSDGTTYALTGLAITSTGTSTADYLTGTNITNDTINGLAGDDYISAYGGNDILNGGIGQDYLYGGTGDDTYIFKAGDSTLATPDYIIEYLNEGVDTIKLTGGILPANIQMWADTSSLHIRYSTNNEIIMQTGYDSTSGSSAAEQYIEKIAFDNGTVWDLRSGLNMTDTNDSHYIYGSMNADIINGMGGDDLFIWICRQ